MAEFDVKFLKPFIEGAKTTLRVQCGIDSNIAPPYIKGKGKDQEISVEIAALIGLTSPSFHGTMALLFSKSLFIKIMSNMLGEEVKEVTEEVEDGAAELLNIIFGWAKKTLSQQGYEVQKAIPTVIRGTNVKPRHLTNAPVYVLPVKTEFGLLHIEICIENDEKKLLAS